jgi:hypothetical protein
MMIFPIDGQNWGALTITNLSFDPFTKSHLGIPQVLATPTSARHRGQLVGKRPAGQAPNKHWEIDAAVHSPPK